MGAKSLTYLLPKEMNISYPGSPFEGDLIRLRKMGVIVDYEVAGCPRSLVRITLNTSNPQEKMLIKSIYLSGNDRDIPTIGRAIEEKLGLKLADLTPK